jgi:hypothetical protein
VTRLVAEVPHEDYITPAVRIFLAEADDFRYDRDIRTAATYILKGKLYIVVGDAYMGADQRTKDHILRHEAAHFISNHIGRCKDRQPRPWNAVTDAAIHECGAADYKVIEEGIQKVPGFETFQCVIFDRLTSKYGGTIPPMPPETAYDFLPEEHVLVGCGSLEQGKFDGSGASYAKACSASVHIRAGDKDFRDAVDMRTKTAGDGHGGMRDIENLPPPKPWIRRTIQYLIRTQQRTERARSWRRENRTFHMLPGQSAMYGKGAAFLVDASGSVPQEDLDDFLACILRTPELKGSVCAIFDGEVSPLVPVANMRTVLETAKKFRGGTSFLNAAKVRVPELPTVWLTDGYPNDGWPTPHTHNEVWCITSDVVAPHGITFHIKDKE